MSPRPLAGSRLRRVLALVPWIAEHPGAAVADIAARFGVSEGELERDLELLPLCGLPPYTPDRLIEVEIVDGHVWIRFAEYFDPRDGTGIGGQGFSWSAALTLDWLAAR